MPTGDIMRASIEGHFDGEPVIIDLGFVSNSGAATFAEDAGALAVELKAALGLDAPDGAFLAPLSGGYTVDSVRIQDLAPGVAAGIVVGVGYSGGNVVDDALAPQLALCVTWRTDLKGKSNRGRSYLTGFAEDSQNAGYWIGEIQTWAGTNFASALLNAFGPFGPGNYQLSVVHTVLGGARLIPPTATPITSYSLHNEVRSLRRRGVGVRISRHRAGG
jgi:hypothetical protein